MAKRIILLSDGTGNTVSNVWRTNVWRTFESLDLTSSGQVAMYDDGVGTSAFKPLAIFGGAFGWGLKRNVLDLYKFLCRNYGQDAEIFAFGFSRGAFTVRVLTGLIAHQGVLRFASEAELNRQAKAAYRVYRADRYQSVFRIEKPFRLIRDAGVRAWNWVTGAKNYDPSKNIEVQSIQFIGVWDTVAAYGLPIDEMTRGVSQWIWPLELPDRKLNAKVERACHALAIDDERTTFHPLLWTEEGESAPNSPPTGQDGLRPSSISSERLTQVWFIGAHSNAGGGYPEDSLAHIPLYWMLTEAQHCGLKLRSAASSGFDALLRAKSGRDKEGRLYDSRKGLGGYYRYGPRKFVDLCNAKFSSRPNDSVKIDLPKIYESVFGRIKGTDVYAPIGLPERYAIVKDNGDVVIGDPACEASTQASARAKMQEKVWDLVWARRIVYFLTVAASLHLAAFPLLYQTYRADEYETPLRFVSELIRLAGALLPGVTSFWLNSYAANPVKFVISAGLVAGLMMWGSRLGTMINDRMKAIWSTGSNAGSLPSSLIYKLRTSRPYQLILRVLKQHILPALSAAVLVYAVLAFVSHVALNIADGAGAFCRETATPQTLPRSGEVALTSPFPIKSQCWNTGLRLSEGERYSVKITETSPWRNNGLEVDVGGLEIAGLPTWWERVKAMLTMPFRRVLLRPWYRPIARIGDVGTDEYFIDPDRVTPLSQPKDDEISAVFRARRTGQLFLYLNSGGLAIPGAADYFYRKLSGEAMVVVKHLARGQN